MRRRWKKVILAALVVVVLLAVVAALSIDGIARRAVEYASTQTLGVETTLHSFKLRLLRGEVSMSDLKVDNPQGFNSASFLTLGLGQVQVAPTSLLKPTVVVPRLNLERIEMNLEKKGNQANYDVILKHLKSQDQQDKNAQPGKKFIINDLTIRNVTVHVDLLPLPGMGGKLTRMDVAIPEIQLKNIGSNSNQGVVLAEVTNQVTKAILTAVVKKTGGVLPPEIATGLSEGLAQLKDVSKLGMQVTGEAGKAANDALNQAGKAVEGLGGFLTPKKDAKPAP